MEDNITLTQMHKRHIKGTPNKAIVIDKTVLVCNLTNAVLKATEVKSPKIYINTRILKHLYDRKPAEEFECILKFMAQIVKYPDHVYINKDAKRGDILVVKKVGEHEYIASIEHRPADEMCVVVTCFRQRSPNYLKGYNHLWSWKGGTPSS